MKWIIAVVVVLISVLIYFCYQDHIEWVKYKNEFRCAETGEKKMTTYIYLININNQLLPQQGINIHTQYYCELNKQYVWR